MLIIWQPTKRTSVYFLKIKINAFHETREPWVSAKTATHCKYSSYVEELHEDGWSYVVDVEGCGFEEVTNSFEIKENEPHIES